MLALPWGLILPSPYSRLPTEARLGPGMGWTLRRQQRHSEISGGCRSSQTTYMHGDTEAPSLPGGR